MRITPLDNWVKLVTEGDLRRFQLKKLNETLKTAQNGAYYKKTVPSEIVGLFELTALPTMNSDVLTKEETGLVCAPQDEVARIVTLMTSGTTGNPKRVYFTESDQELTVDYFANGLQTVVTPGGTMAILLPCRAPGGVGDLIARALGRISVTPLRHGLVSDLQMCAEALCKNKADSLVGIPVQILTLARYCAAKGIRTNIKSVLLSTDNIPRVIVQELERLWCCEVFCHYGMTEMGLGCAIDCAAHDGYHVRENDIFVEILDDRGVPVPDGEYGELTFTTLTRRAMPFIRYRTEDITRIIRGSCKCGSELLRIAPIAGRIGGKVFTDCGTSVSIEALDEILFAVPQVCDFTAVLSPHKDKLSIKIDAQRGVGTVSADEIVRGLRESLLTDGLEVQVSVMLCPDIVTRRDGKRRISVLRE